jgi:hypothetical protein
MATLNFKEDGGVKGVLERLQPQPPSSRRLGSTSGGGAVATAATVADATGVAGRLSSVYGVIGNFTGSMYDKIDVTCPELVGWRSGSLDPCGFLGHLVWRLVLLDLHINCRSAKGPPCLTLRMSRHLACY